MAPRTDRSSRIIDAPASAIYRALTDGEALVQWLPPAGMTATMVAFDPRPGGLYRMVLRYDDPAIAGKSGGNEDIAEGRFIALVPDQAVIQAIDFVSDDPGLSGTMTMSWLLRPVGGATEVRIIAEHVPPGISAADHAEGMASSLANLAAYLKR